MLTSWKANQNRVKLLEKRISLVKQRNFPPFLFLSRVLFRQFSFKMAGVRPVLAWWCPFFPGGRATIAPPPFCIVLLNMDGDPCGRVAIYFHSHLINDVAPTSFQPECFPIVFSFWWEKEKGFYFFVFVCLVDVGFFCVCLSFNFRS